MKLYTHTCHIYLIQEIILPRCIISTMIRTCINAVSASEEALRASGLVGLELPDFVSERLAAAQTAFEIYKALEPYIHLTQVVLIDRPGEVLETLTNWNNQLVWFLPTAPAQYREDGLCVGSYAHIPLGENMDEVAAMQLLKYIDVTVSGETHHFTTTPGDSNDGIDTIITVVSKLGAPKGSGLDYENKLLSLEDISVLNFASDRVLLARSEKDPAKAWVLREKPWADGY